MSTPQDRYNSLPSLDDANLAFTDRTVLLKLRDVFTNHGRYGVCLLHRHTTIEGEELMVRRGNITQPERPGTTYPQAWFRTGEPFEFSVEETPGLPSDLLKGFQEVVGGVEVSEGRDVLGICYLDEGAKWGELFLEITEGRKNIVERIEVKENWPEISTTVIATCWLPTLSSPNLGPVVVLCCKNVGGVHQQVQCEETGQGSLACIIATNNMQWNRAAPQPGL